MGTSHSHCQGPSVPYEVKLDVYKNVMAAITAKENEEMQKSAPGFCRLSLYWFQNIIAVPEGLLRLVWHLLFSLLLCPCYIGALPPSPIEEAAAYQAQEHHFQSRPGALENPSVQATTSTPLHDHGSGAAQQCCNEDCCAVPMFQHHSTMVKMYFESLRVILTNIIKPWKPVWLYNLSTPVERPTPPPKPSRKVKTGNCLNDCLANCIQSCIDSCVQSCVDSCTKCFAQALELATYVTLRLTRAMYCAFSCHHSCHWSVVCGPCCKCCRRCYEDLPARTERWAHQHLHDIEDHTREFYRSTYGVETYEEHCAQAYAAYLNPPVAVPAAEVMDREESKVAYATTSPSAPPQKEGYQAV